MMYNIKTGYGGIRRVPNKELVLLVTSLHRLEERRQDYVFTDRHAYLKTAQFYNSVDDLAEIDWQLLKSRDFTHDPNDPAKPGRYQAEALVYQRMAIQDLLGIVCWGQNEVETLMQHVTNRRLDTKVVARPCWFFR